MAEYRQFSCLTWQDIWYQDLKIDEKLLFAYFFTNERTTVVGIYEISVRTMAFETGISIERVDEIIHKFELAKKLRYEDGILWVFNMPKYQGILGKKISSKLLIRIQKDVRRLPESQIKRDFIAQHGAEYGIDRVSIGYPQIDSETDTDTESETESETETETETTLAAAPQKTPTLLSLRDAERVYCQVTKHPTIPGGMHEYLEKILDLLQKFGEEETRRRLKLAWEGWCTSKRKNGIPYARTNPAWIDYAIVGEVPKGDQKPALPGHKSYAAEIAKELTHAGNRDH